MSEKCWACGGAAISEVFRIRNLALSSLILMEDREEARRFPRGDLELVVCEDCGFIYNRAFRPELVDYTMPYESSQVFSPRFRQFADQLIDHLATDYHLAGKEVLEIGCGDASFLQELCKKAGALGFGIDPTFDHNRIEEGSNVSGVAEFYDADHIDLGGDLICCRHTLEHIQPVAEFVSWVRESALSRDGTVVFFEIPDTERILVEGAFWDIYNEHCSYFTVPSLSNLFRSQGFDVIRIGKGFDDQYLLIDAVPGVIDNTTDEAAVIAVVDLASTFGDNVRGEIGSWRRVLEQAHDAGRRTVLWGASSKAVAFLAAVDRDHTVTAAVDINPFKQDKFLPGSGLTVLAPEALLETRPDLVVIMNPVYRNEVTATLEELALSPDVLALGDSLGNKVPA
ncbi:MAG TPA: class I SAM-dependent methyltransferase [Acidimicrobiia bacterium]|nr:class I SAM-dependent methyltransferase [Acidimicrobiia bacterium]